MWLCGNVCGFLGEAMFRLFHPVSGCFNQASNPSHRRLRTLLMPIELRTQRDGKLRKHWYGRYSLSGRRHYLNLGVRVLGAPPASLSLRDEGDGAFERSRAAAQAKLDSIVEETRTKRDSTRLVEKIYEIKTGERLQPVKLTELSEAWAKLPRKREPKGGYLGTSQSTLRRFAEFVRIESP